MRLGIIQTKKESYFQYWRIEKTQKTANRSNNLYMNVKCEKLMSESHGLLKDWMRKPRTVYFSRMCYDIG